MGAAKEWLIVATLGLATFGGLLLSPDASRLGPGHEASSHTVILPFAQVNTARDQPATLLGVLRPPAANVTGCARVAVGGAYEPPEPFPHADGGLGPVDCAAPGVIILHVGTRGFSSRWGQLEDGEPFGVRVVEGPALGAEGYNATRVTVHVFDANGELVFSNGNASEQARLTRTLTPEQLPKGVWYLGANATAPAGTQKPPLAAQAFLPQVRHLIDGLPVGGVATTQTDALATWYGTLFVTLRVDELVHAP